MVPNLLRSLFVAVRTEGDDLAAYFHTRLLPMDPTKAQVIQTLFVRVGGRWKLLLRGAVHTFPFDPMVDIQDSARALLDTVECLQLRPPPATS